MTSPPTEKDQRPWDARLIERMSRGSGTQATKKQQNKANVAMSVVHVFVMTGAASLAGGYFWLLPAIVFVALCLRLFKWIRARRTGAEQGLAGV